MTARLMPVAALALVAAAACGGGSDIPDDPRVLTIGFVAETATQAYAADGPAGLYEFLAPEAKQRCSLAAFEDSLGGREAPTAFRALDKVQFEGDEARVTFTIVVKDHDEELTWLFAPDPAGNWYVSQVPGMEGCGS